VGAWCRSYKARCPRASPTLSPPVALLSLNHAWPGPVCGDKPHTMSWVLLLLLLLILRTISTGAFGIWDAAFPPGRHLFGRQDASCDPACQGMSRLNSPPCVQHGRHLQRTGHSRRAMLHHVHFSRRGLLPRWPVVLPRRVCVRGLPVGGCLLRVRWHPGAVGVLPERRQRLH